MSTVAGYKAVLIAANAYGRYFPLLTTAAGTAKPANVLILGIGVAGLQAIGTAILLPIGVAAWLWNGRPAVSAEAFWLAIGSGVVEAIYFVCLSAAYKRGDLSLVYALARGSAPLLAVAVGILLLEEDDTDRATLRIACHNFYVITRYNRSRLYAAAVYELAQATRAARASASPSTTVAR